MLDYTIDVDSTLDVNTIQKIINNFEFEQKPILQKYKNYYDGKQQILQKTMATGKPNHKIVVNYCADIVDNYTGYLSGIPVSYTSEDAGFEEIQNTLNYNDVSEEDTNILQNALIYGKAFEIMYIDADSQVRFKIINPENTIAIYGNDVEHELKYVIRYYPENAINYDYSNIKCVIEIYDKYNVQIYKSDSQFGSLQFIRTDRHYFNDIPIIVFNLNNDRISVFDKILTMQDAYNDVLSSTINDWDSFCDAYMIFKGAEIENEELDLMREKRCICIPPEANLEYLTKNINDTISKDMLQTLNDQTHKISKSPDYNSDKFMSASGVAMQYKLCGMENNAANIKNNWKKALQRRIELICNIIVLKGSNAAWRDVQITFTPNLPANDFETAQVINQLRGVVTDKTLISQLSFVTDPQAEVDAMAEQQQASLDMYNFGGNGEDTDSEDKGNPSEVI